MARVAEKSGNSPIGTKRDIPIGKVFAVRAQSTQQLIPTTQSGRLLSLYIVMSSSAGSVVIRSGDSNGEIIGSYGTSGIDRTITTDFGVSDSDTGLSFSRGLHVTLTDVEEVTITYRISFDKEGPLSA